MEADRRSKVNRNDKKFYLERQKWIHKKEIWIIAFVVFTQQYPTN